MHTFDREAHDRWLARACFWLSLAIFHGVLTNLVIILIHGGDLGQFLSTILLITPAGIAVCLLFSAVAATKYRRGTILLAVKVVLLAVFACAPWWISVTKS